MGSLRCDHCAASNDDSRVVVEEAIYRLVLLKCSMRVRPWWLVGVVEEARYKQMCAAAINRFAFARCRVSPISVLVQ